MVFSKSIFILAIGAIIFVSCKTEVKKENTNNSQTLSNEIVHSLENPSLGNSSLPRLFGSNNQLFMSWVEIKDSISILYFSKYKDEKWSLPTEIISGDDWFINWADFPVIAENNGNIFSSYLQKSANGKYTYDVKINLFSSETQEWKKSILLHNDGIQSEHGFVSVVPQGEASFYVAWLDGRNTGSHEGHGEHGTGSMTIRGRLVHVDGTMEPEKELDPRVCDCCQTAMTSINDEPILVYRDRSDTEVRDISLVKIFADNIPKAKTIFEDNWQIDGCPVNGPAIASFKNNFVVAWFTAVDENPKVQLVFSTDGGKSFGENIQVNTFETLGRVDVVMISEDTAIVSWMENVDKETMIKAMRVSSNDANGFPITISKTTAVRASGFPQLEVVGNIAYVAWTAVDGQLSSIKTATFAITDL